MRNRKFRKSDIETHEVSRYMQMLPAVNVKAHHGARGLVDAIVERFGYSVAQAEVAAQFAWDSACEMFWEDAASEAPDFLGHSVKVWSAGRCGGWLVVEGLPDVDGWDAVAVSRWGRFAQEMRSRVDYYGTRDGIACMLDEIDANEWYKDGSERYNFVDTSAGPACIAGMKAQARAAGFGAVVRK